MNTANSNLNTVQFAFRSQTEILFRPTTMKSDADPYEFFRWKSSCGRLVVRTTWVKGVRHVVLSDEDDEDKEKRQPRKSCNHAGDSSRKTTPAPTSRPPLGEIDENHEPSSWCNYSHNGGGGGGDESYVERVLQWLQKPTGMLETRRKPMSAPGHGIRRPALVKTCSIPENKFADQQVVEADCKRPPKSTRNYCAKSHNQKTELHVHMPSVCPAADENGKDVSNE